MASKKPETDTTTYLVERGKERLHVTVPSSWRVTFGPMVPSKQQGRGYQQYGGYEAPNCLRFYEATDKQRAIFTGVTAFRDMSIPVKKLVESVEEKHEAKRDHKGGKSATEIKRAEVWVDEV